MKNLVLGSLMFAALATQTTGCIITSDDDGDDFATINAEWSFHTVNPQGAISPGNNCPTGFPTVALHSQELDASDRPIGAEVIDLFDCDARRDFSDELLPGVYETFIRITSDGGGSVYAESIPEIVDVTINDATIRPEIIDNGGRFKVAWNLRDMQTDAAISCRDAARLDGIEVTSTLASSAGLINDQFDCERGFDFTDAVPKGTYVISMNAFMDGQPDVAIGETATLNNKVLGDRNDVGDLGTVTLRVPRN